MTAPLVHRAARFAAAPALLLALLAAGCADGQAGAAAALGGPALAARQASGNPHAAPEKFAPEVISGPQEEWRITFTPDGDTAYFARSPFFFPITRQATILRSHRTADGWSAPEVADFSGVYSDIDPFITSDGQRLYFSSIRPVDGVPRPDADVWVVERTAGGSWGAPVNLGPAVNGPTDELYPSVDDDGTLYVGSDRPGGLGGWDIYRARSADGAFLPLENLGAPVNTPTWEFNPAISPDGRRLVFTALSRPDGLGLGDLYVSHFHQGAWTPGANLGPPVNTEFDEYHPSFSADGKELFFVRRMAALGVRGDLYSIKVSRLGNRLRPGGSLPPAR